MMLELLFSFIRDFSFLDFVVRSTLPLLLVTLAYLLLRNDSAAIRHRVLLLGLTASLVVPVAAWFLPKVTIPLLPSQVTAKEWGTTTSSGRLIDANRLAKAATPAGATAFDAANPELSKAVSEATSDASVQANKSLLSHAFRISAKQILVLCWLAGVLFGTTVFLVGTLRQAMRLQRFGQIDDQPWEAAVAATAQRIGLARNPKTIVADQHCVPSTTGIFTPILVVPCHWKHWSPEQRDCILLHELAHIRRRDVAAQCLARVAILVHWFNPLVWFAARRLRVERELASDDCVLQAGHIPSQYAEQLLATVKEYRPLQPAMGVAMASSARLDDRVRAILDPNAKRQPVGRCFSLLTALVVGLSCVIAAGVTPFATLVQANEPSDPKAPVWKENYTVRYEKTLPVSVAFSPDGKRLLTGNADGELMDLNIDGDEPTYNWKTNVGGSHPAIAFALDGKTVFATTTDGVRVLDAIRGDEQALVQEKDSQPIAVGVFPKRQLDDQNSQTQIVFGNARGYFVKSWVTGRLPDTVGTITTSRLANGKEPSDELAVPLAVDPKGRSAIMIGPIDGTGQFTGQAGTNVLWAYVCGDYEAGSPGNRIMQGHTDSVISAAWSQEGSVAVTGDTEGLVIEWNAAEMKETHRRQLGGRIAALAISNNGKRVAAYVLGKRGRLVVWNTNDLANAKTIHVEAADLSASTVFASLDFSPDGNRIAGCVGDRTWLEQADNLVGRVRVWEIATAPANSPHRS